MNRVLQAIFKACFWFLVCCASQNTIAQDLTWSDDTSDLSATGQDATEQQIALSSDGTQATAVWRRYDGSNWRIQSKSATISGNTITWGAVTDLSTTAGQHAKSPQIALSSDGSQATATWNRQNWDGSNNIIQSTSATISGNTATWGAVTDLSAAGQMASLPQIALSSDGSHATAAWHRFDGSNTIVQSTSATISGNTATWGAVTDLSTTAGQHAYYPQIALSSDGSHATAVLRRHDGSSNIVQSTSATISGNTATWGTVTDLSAAGQSALSPQIALSSDGTQATAVWRRWGGSRYIIQSTSATISGNTATWGAVTDLSAAGQHAWNPQITLSSDGTQTTAVWRHYDGSNYIVQSKSATISGNTAAWGATTDLSAVGQNAETPQIALSSDGSQATAVWRRFDGSNWIVQITSTTISGNTATWGAVTDLSATGQSAWDPQIALSSDGSQATATWNRWDGLNTIVQSKSTIGNTVEDTLCNVIKGSNGKTVVFCL